MRSEPRPRLRILHQMARSGGTVICRCLGAMEDVVLLSEIHPAGTEMYNPLEQAVDWYGLLTDEDIARVGNEVTPFTEAIALVERRCRERGKRLVLRDWSHLDYTGVPFTRPVYRSRLAEALADRFELVRHSTVRHPLDQWLSMNRQRVLAGRLTPEAFVEGAARFADLAHDTGFTRYEAFVADPDAALRSICAALRLDFDPSWRNRWRENEHVTGDVHGGRAGDEIRALPRPPIAEKAGTRLAAVAGWAPLLERLGYPPA